MAERSKNLKYLLKAFAMMKDEDTSYQSPFVPWSTQQKIYESIVQFTNLSSYPDQLSQYKTVPVSSESTNQTASGGPMLFNPASFQKQSQPTVATGAGSRLSQRRIYPK